MAIAGRKCQVKVSGGAVPFTTQATTANGTFTQYQINAANMRVWDRSAAVSVTRSPDGVAAATAVPAGEYTVNRLTGTITFGAAQPAAAVIRVSGSYLPLSAAAEAREYTYTLSASNQDVSKMGDTAVSRIQGLKDVTGSLSHWATVDHYFEDQLAADAPVVLEFYSDNAANAVPDLRAWAMVSKAEMKAAVDGLAETSVEWEGATDLEGRMISSV